MVITSAKHPLVAHLISLRKEASYRKQVQRAVLFGDKLIRELVVPIERLFYTEDPPHISAKECIHITEPLLKKMSGLPAPETLAAEIIMPAQSDLSSSCWILALDGVADPGNLGSLLRSASALGWDGVWMLPSTCDPYNDKALRAAKGATFHIPWRQGDMGSFLAFAKTRPFSVCIADKEGPPVRPLLPPCILIMGSEGKGASDVLKNQYTTISIPMMGSIESLNVAAAGAILLHALKA